jgi:porphobilinogen synthase
MSGASHLPRPERRPRRLRQSAVVRGLVRETRLTPQQLILPLFVIDGDNVREPIGAMPGHARLSIDLAIEKIREAMKLGVGAFALFPAINPKKKTADAAEAVNPDNLLCQAVRQMREAAPEAVIVTDIALDPYSSMGHDGLISPKGEVLNDETVDVLARMAVLHADAGAQIVAPSDMMDGRVAAMREALDEEGHQNTAILSYTAKYASGYYGPFREALDSAPVDAPNVPADKKTYQMDPANSREASIEALLDEAEGADILMVKPALSYLDVIHAVKQKYPEVPLAAYNVSGEYSMVKAAASQGLIDEQQITLEILTSIKRAGADMILTYSAKDVCHWLDSSS